ncbi:PAS domain-containing protein [Streptomyces sp. NPDC050564]|uniref:PAS domain-containing protein n=1 Tax=Streptomyces sp. NPDC050564 TaxID=3365631 RepID=UPI00379540E7
MIRYAGFRPTSGDGFVPATELAAAAVDAHGTVTAWSPGVQLLLGYVPEDVVGCAAAEPPTVCRTPRGGTWPIGRRGSAGFCCATRPAEAELRACPLLNGKGEC